MRTLFAIAIAAGIVWAASARAEDLLWRVSNNVTPTVVPAYAGQLSPFPYIKKDVKQVTPTLSAEELAEQKQRARALQQAELVLSNVRRALVPQLDAVRVEGVISGQAGTKVLLNNNWVGVGTHVPVPLVRSQAAQQALSMLHEYDSIAADKLEHRFADLMSRNTLVNLTVSKIDSKGVTFSSAFGMRRLPLPQADE